MTARERQHANSIAAIVLTFNEEQNLPACLQSLRGVVDPLLVIDSGSSDCTREIATDYGAQVYQHPFQRHATQWRWALAQLPAQVEWVLALDADQSLTPALREEIRTLASCRSELHGYSGFYVRRRQIFRGRWLRHGGYYPKYLLKLFRVADVEIDDRDLMDHHFYVRGRVGRLQADIIEDNKKESVISFWIEKHIRYAELHAREELLRKADSQRWLIRPSLRGTPDERVVWLKDRWYHLPLYLRPFLYFTFRYILQLGFLDGKEGFIFHFLQAFWYRLLVDINIEDMRASTLRSTSTNRT